MLDETTRLERRSSMSFHSRHRTLDNMRVQATKLLVGLVVLSVAAAIFTSTTTTNAQSLQRAGKKRRALYSQPSTGEIVKRVVRIESHYSSDSLHDKVNQLDLCVYVQTKKILFLTGFLLRHTSQR